jgi:hypothetical protein
MFIFLYNLNEILQIQMLKIQFSDKRPRIDRSVAEALANFYLDGEFFSQIFI